MTLRKPTHWTDTALPLGPDGGTYLPVATEWSLYRQRVRTAAAQRRMEIKLRLYCYVQKVWFDDLSVVELPVNAVGAAGGGRVAECSTSPAFSLGTTRRFDSTDALPDGVWFVHEGVLDQHGLPCWLSERRAGVGAEPWQGRDTTTPAVNRALPVPGAAVGPRPVISAAFADDGSGIDIASARVLLDGEDVTRQAEVTRTGLLLKPRRTLGKGVHRVEVTVADRAGNRSNRLA